MEYTQRSLFDDSNLLGVRFFQCLRDFNIDGAIADFSELGRSFYPPMRFAEKRTALDSLRVRIASMDRKNLELLAGYYRELEGGPIPALLDSEWSSIRSGFYAELSRILPVGFCGFLIPDMPASEIHLECGEYQNALEAAFHYMAGHEEDSLNRQIQSFAVAKMGDSRAARRYLGMALFNDPRRCRERFFADEEIRAEWCDVCGRNTNDEAWVEFPLQLWRKKIIRIQEMSDDYERWIMGKTETDEAPASIRFLHLLILAEKRRYRDDPGGLLEEYRKRMRETQPDKFIEYMATLSRWEKE